MKKLFSVFLTMLCLVTACAMPASAEGFEFGWDTDPKNPNGPHCKAYLMLNLDTDTVVYSENADERLPMASITKIMSYIIAYENIPDIENTLITIPQSVVDELHGTGSSVAEFSVGETYTGLDLLYLMMVPSGNNAALTLAKYVDQLYADGKIGGQTTDSSSSSASESGDSSSQSSASESGDGSSQSSATESGDSSSSSSTTDDPEAVSQASSTQSQTTLSTENLAPAYGEEGFDGSDYTGRSYFVQLMNEKAAELGCTNTHFTNPHGLHNENHYSTARDLVTITKYAMSLPHFTEITGTTAYNYYPQENPDLVRTANTTNRMLTNYATDDVSYYYAYATGIKTGSHDQAGYCIVASATYSGYTYVVCCLGSPEYDAQGNSISLHGEMLDAATLFRWALTSLGKMTVVSQGDILADVPLEYAWQKDTLQLVAGENVSVMLPTSVDTSSIIIETDVPESVQAPVERGQQVGTATMSYAGEVIATVPLVAAESVSRSEMMSFISQGTSVLTSPWFLIIMGVILLLIIVYIILILLYRRKQKQLRRVRKYRDL
ncbi:MAG: D-alanyl-D-alanine carboxypeptidase family protein [Acutalibacter sp.]|jgi:D-alanyl-D-alanine carboxypeptidase (penicillin-binding protein 5/6)